MRISVLIIFLLTVYQKPFLWAQQWQHQVPDYAQISQNIQKGNPNYDHEVLMSRFRMGGEDLTLEQKRHLYYGYTFHPGYAPYSQPAVLAELLRLMDQPAHTANELASIIALADQMLEEVPFHLDALNYQLYALEATGIKDKFELRLNQLMLIIDVIFSSGNGLTPESGFYLIYPDHALEIISILGFAFAGNRGLIDQCEYLELEKNTANLAGLYFNIAPCLRKLSND